MDKIQSPIGAQSDSLKLFADVLPEGITKGPKPTNGMLMIFLKCFDTQKQELYGVAKIFVHHNMKIEDLNEIVSEKMNWNMDTHIEYYEEVKPETIERLDPKTSFLKRSTNNGDIICFQAGFNQNQLSTDSPSCQTVANGFRLLDLKARGLPMSPITFYDSLQDLVMVHMRPNYKAETDDGFILELKKSLTYDQV
jgi:ubiquitin carboxyl-terminal hydrolase 7